MSTLVKFLEGMFRRLKRGNKQVNAKGKKKMDLQNQGRKSNHYFNVKFWHQMLWSYNTVSVVLAVQHETPSYKR